MLWYYVIVINNDHIKPRNQMNKTELKQLDQKSDLKSVISALNQVIQIVSVERDRGPKSTRPMSNEDAVRIVSGDLKNEKVGKIAEDLGLSYGQVYSARNGFTFKKVK